MRVPLRTCPPPTNPQIRCIWSPPTPTPPPIFSCSAGPVQPIPLVCSPGWQFPSCFCPACVSVCVCMCGCTLWERCECVGYVCVALCRKCVWWCLRSTVWNMYVYVSVCYALVGNECGIRGWRVLHTVGNMCLVGVRGCIHCLWNNASFHFL